MTPNNILIHARAYAHAHMATWLSAVIGVMAMQPIAMLRLASDGTRRHARDIRGATAVIAAPRGAVVKSRTNAQETVRCGFRAHPRNWNKGEGVWLFFLRISPLLLGGIL